MACPTDYRQERESDKRIATSLPHFEFSGFAFYFSASVLGLCRNLRGRFGLELHILVGHVSGVSKMCRKKRSCYIENIEEVEDVDDTNALYRSLVSMLLV